MSDGISKVAPRAVLRGICDIDRGLPKPKVWSLSVSPELVFVLNKTLITQFNATKVLDGYEFVNKPELDTFYYGQPKYFLTTCPDEIELIYRDLIGITQKPIAVLASVVGGLISFSVQYEGNGYFVTAGNKYNYE